MKRSMFRIFCLAGLVCGLAGCGTKTANEAGKLDEAVGVEEGQQTEKAPEDVPVMEESSGVYTIIYDSDLSGKAVKACERLQEVLGEELVLCADQDKTGTAATVSEYEVLLGATNRPESAAVGEGLGLYDYRIEVQGKKLVVAGGSNDAVIGAIAHLIWDDTFSLENSVAENSGYIKWKTF